MGSPSAAGAENSLWKRRQPRELTNRHALRRLPYGRDRLAAGLTDPTRPSTMRRQLLVCMPQGSSTTPSTAVPTLTTTRRRERRQQKQQQQQLACTAHTCCVGVWTTTHTALAVVPAPVQLRHLQTLRRNRLEKGAAAEQQRLQVPGCFMWGKPGAAGTAACPPMRLTCSTTSPQCEGGWA